MAAWRYEISLLVLKKYFTCSLRSHIKYFATPLRGKFCISVQYEANQGTRLGKILTNFADHFYFT